LVETTTSCVDARLRIGNDGNPRPRRQKRGEYLQALAHELEGEKGHPGARPTGPGEALVEFGFDRIAAIPHDDGGRAGEANRAQHGATLRDDDVHVQLERAQRPSDQRARANRRRGERQR
jgi:hypothetical protein